MEVHHSHSHHEGKSTWKSYLKEFLMLFLAVFCGSIAEYFLEHKVDNDRVHRYMIGLHNDLKADTAMLSNTITYATAVSNGLDSLQNSLYHFSDTKENIQNVYRQNFTFLRWIHPDFNDRTAAQLRYSGNFRLIHNTVVSDAISNYWIGTGMIMKNADLFIDKTALAQESGNTLFNRQFVTYPDTSYTGFHINFIIVNPEAVMMTTDKNTLIAYANRLGRMTDISEHYLIPLLKDQLIKAKNLIKMIEDEYDIR